MNNNVQLAFQSWLDRVLVRKIPKETVAFHFNLYEAEDAFHVQLIGAEEFSSDDPDWPCAETFSTEEDVFELPHSAVGEEWEQGLEAAKAAVQQYLATGTRAATLRASQGVGVGFVDGDVHVVWEATGNT